jgi:hypothetical protein
MVRRLFGKAKTDDGVALLLIAVSMTFIIGMAALAIDLGALRGDIRADQLAADAAVTAGVAEVDPFSGSDARQACEVAWDYLLLNLDDEGTSVSPPNCALLGGSCTPGVAREATGSAGPYSFVITNPVPDGHTLMGSQTVNTLIDGVPCQRLGVSIQRTRDHWFARVIGSASGLTNVGAVARHAAGVGGGEVVPLLVLEPISCDALFTSGQGKVTVSWFMDTPGFIVIDSDGSKTDNPNRCGSSSWTIDSKGNQNGWIRAIPTPSGIPSVILSYALSGAAGSNPARAYDLDDITSPVDPADITDPAELLLPQTWFRLFPTPSFVSQRITRSALDHRYNCQAVYPDYPLDLGNPGLGGIPISPCLDAPAPHIDNLVAAYKGPLIPTGSFQQWTIFPDGTPRYPCQVDDTTWGPASIAVAGDWWVDCPGGLIIGNSKTVVFSAGNVVLDGDIDLRAFGTLRVNPAPTTDHVIFIRNGDLKKGAQTSIFLQQTMVFLQNGRIDIGAGAGGLTWIAPLNGNFEDLALWSEAPLQHQIGGQAGNTLTGTFFTPFADPFSLTGQSGQFQTDAQFVTRRLEVKGQGEVKMHPDPDRSTLIPIREVRLIR